MTTDPLHDTAFDTSLPWFDAGWQWGATDGLSFIPDGNRVDEHTIKFYAQDAYDQAKALNKPQAFCNGAFCGALFALSSESPA